MSSVFSKVVNTLLHNEDVLPDGNTGHRLLACLSTTVVNFLIGSAILRIMVFIKSIKIKC